MLAALLKAGYAGKVLLPLVDPPAVQRAFEVGVGQRARFSLGGVLDSRFKAVELEATVEMPVEATVEMPAETTAEMPVEATAEMPAEMPAEATVEATAEMPAEMPKRLPPRLRRNENAL